VVLSASGDSEDAILGLPKTRKDDEEMRTEEGDGMEPEGRRGVVYCARIW
jgi:hypothetical protein